MRLKSPYVPVSIAVIFCLDLFPYEIRRLQRAQKLAEVCAYHIVVDIVLAADRLDDGIDVAGAVEQRPDPRRDRREHIDGVEVADAIADGHEDALVPYLPQSKLAAVLEHSPVHP